MRQNVAWLSAGNAVAKPIWLLFITATCMRALGPAGYGTLTVSLALAATATALAELGAGEYATREIARRPAVAGLFFSNLLAARAVLAPLVFGAAMIAGWALGYGREALVALIAASAYTLGLRTAEFCRGFYRAFEVLRFEAGSLLLERVLVVAAGAVGLFATHSALGTLIGLATGMAASLALNVGWIHRRLAPIDRSIIDPRFVRETYTRSLPIGLFVLFSAALLSTGPVVVHELLGDSEAGVYGAASRLVEMTLLLPTVVFAAVLPRLSALHHDGAIEAFWNVVRRSLLSLGTAAVVAALAAVILGPLAVGLLSGGADFADSGLLLQLMGWVVIPMSLKMLVGAALIAADEQRFLATVSGICAAGNVLVSILLVPYLGGAGAVIALFCAYTCIFVAGLIRLRGSVRPAVSPAAANFPPPPEPASVPS